MWRTWLLRIVAAFVAVYGAYAFLVREFTEYMFLRTQFVFYDFGETLPSFFMDYLAVMALFVCIGHYMAKGIVGFSKRKKSTFPSGIAMAFELATYGALNRTGLVRFVRKETSLQKAGN